MKRCLSVILVVLSLGLLAVSVHASSESVTATKQGEHLGYLKIQRELLKVATEQPRFGSTISAVLKDLKEWELNYQTINPELSEFELINQALQREADIRLKAATSDQKDLALIALAQQISDMSFELYELRKRADDIEFADRENAESYLTEKFTKVRFVVFIDRDDMSNSTAVKAFVDLRTEPGWNCYLGNGRFSVSDREVRLGLAEAGSAVLKLLDGYGLPGLDPAWVTIEFSIYGHHFGTWNNGKVTLLGE